MVGVDRKGVCVFVLDGAPETCSTRKTDLMMIRGFIDITGEK